jgi:hypothetical protein
MSTLLADPFCRALLTLLTTDHGLPGAPQRIVLLQALQDLRARAETDGASAQVRGAIRSALWALRAEFPTAYAMRPAARSDVGMDP